MKLADMVCFEAVIPELKGKDRDGVIKEMVSALDKARKLGRGNGEEIWKSLIKRENEASTGIGKGVAVPHIKHTAVKEPVAAIGRSGTGIDFSSLDKQPVYSVILLISPSGNPDKHLQAMENIFHTLQNDDFRKFLRQSQTVQQIKELIIEADEKFS